MGQRHQIFVQIANPAKFCSKNLKATLEAEYGTGDTTVLAYHNQWLYGRSALQSALGLLKFGAIFTKDEKETKKGYNYDLPFSPAAMQNNYEIKNFDKIPETIAFILNFKPVKTPWADAGMGTSRYIGKTDEGIREDFTMGDNNDGITIIDLINNKYCFMSIDSYSDRSELGYSANDLEYLQPATARQYVAAYYGETPETINPYYLTVKGDGKTYLPIKKQLSIANQNIRLNTRIAKGFDKFELLTIKDLQRMFPNMKQLVGKEKISLLK